MKILLIAPHLSSDTILGRIGFYCLKAIRNLGHTIEQFDFRRSQYLSNSFGTLLKNVIKKIVPLPRRHLPIVDSLK